MNNNIENIKKQIIEKTIVGNIEEFYKLGFNDKIFLAIYSEKKGSDWIFKLDFLSEFIVRNYSKSMFTQYITIFKKTKVIEAKYEKDICDFTAEEILLLLKSFKMKSYNSVSNKYSLLKGYIAKAKESKVGKLKYSTGGLLKVEDLKEAVEEFKRTSAHCTRTQLEEALMLIKNANDKVVYALLFEGVEGDEYSDLLNLKVKDIDFSTNTLVTPSGKTVSYSNYTKDILKACIRQREALMFDGHRTYQIDTRSPYIVKCKLTGTSNGQAMKYAGLTRKLTTVRNNMALDFITGNAIYGSGLIERIFIYEHNILKRRITTSEIMEYIDNNNEDKDKNSIVRLIQSIGETFREDLKKRNWEIK